MGGAGGARWRAWVVASFLGVALVPALEAPTLADERASAEELFQQGRQAMTKHDYARACSLFEASKKLEDTLGTLLNLAMCHEAQGKVATAWGEFRAAEQRARQMSPPQPNRVDFARQHAAALEPKIPRLQLVFEPDVDLSGVEVRIDGRPSVIEALREGTPIDPGRRVVRLSAPSKQPVELTVEIPGTPTLTTIRPPALKPAPTAPATPSPVASTRTEASGSPTLAYVVGGVGLAFLAGAGVLGAIALGERDDAKCQPTQVGTTTACFATVRDAEGRETPNPEFARASDAYDRATTFANLSTGAVVVGALAIGAALYLFLKPTTGASTPTSAAARPAALVTPGGLAIVFR